MRAATKNEKDSRLDDEVSMVLEQESTTTPAPPGKQSAMAELEIRDRIALAEELAIMEIEAEFGKPVTRNVVHDDQVIDGVTFIGSELTIIETKFTQSPRWDHTILRSINKRRNPVVSSGAKFLLAIVTEGLTAEQRDILLDQATPAMQAASWFTRIRIYDLTELIYDLTELKVKYNL